VDTVVFNKRLRYYQIDAIKALIKNGGGILSMPTASGKTFTIIEYLKIMGKKSLVIVTTLDIKQQWRDEIGDNKNIYVENYQNKSLKSIIKDYDIIVYDESHHTSASTIYSLATATKTNAILIGCSGTPFREDGEDLKLEAALGNIVYKIDRKTLINEGFISNATVKYIKCSFPNDGKFMEYQEVYKTNIVENKDRNDKIVKIAIDNALQKKQVLILITQIEHGTKLLEDIKLKEPNLRIIFMNGGSKDRKIKFTDYDIIIASNIYTEGVNIPAMDVLIIGSGGRSSIQLNQKIGRVLRKTDTKSHAIIYDFIDAPKHLKTHYKRRREILSEDFEVEDE
jgi:superfamily II DNA or RNA helicase